MLDILKKDMKYILLVCVNYQKQIDSGSVGLGIVTGIEERLVLFFSLFISFSKVHPVKSSRTFQSMPHQFWDIFSQMKIAVLQVLLLSMMKVTWFVQSNTCLLTWTAGANTILISYIHFIPFFFNRKQYQLKMNCMRAERHGCPRTMMVLRIQSSSFRRHTWTFLSSTKLSKMHELQCHLDHHSFRRCRCIQATRQIYILSSSTQVEESHVSAWWGRQCVVLSVSNLLAHMDISHTYYSYRLRRVRTISGSNGVSLRCSMMMATSRDDKPSIVFPAKWNNYMSSDTCTFSRL